MEDHFRVGGGLADSALGDQPVAKGEGVGEIAVMGQGKAAGGEVDEQRLDIAHDGIAAGRVAHMADRSVALQALDHLACGKVVADQAQAPLGVEMSAVKADDASGFLAAVLKGMQAESHEGRSVGMAEDTEHAAFLMKAVLVEPPQGLTVSVNVVGHARPRLP